MIFYVIPKKSYVIPYTFIPTPRLFKTREYVRYHWSLNLMNVKLVLLSSYLHNTRLPVAYIGTEITAMYQGVSDRLLFLVVHDNKFALLSYNKTIKVCTVFVILRHQNPFFSFSIILITLSI